ncbi:opioid growth factor receptor-like protein 1 [Phyllobates terribilis]|uniref:opioid growth factor receptor-like protein 1 n=1 Tax=Phyllobates terribilis TaxID=111132 RepID=UPI003CCAE32A
MTFDPRLSHKRGLSALETNYEFTWEHGQPPKKKRKQQHREEMPNLLFYQNRIAFQPYGVRIEDIHHYWWNDYQKLEENHSYIQWLFPLREPGVNPYATPLTPAEIERMRADKDVMWRLLESYKLMLGFYGIQLLDEKTGEVSRTEKWEERYQNLNRRSHNNLRITRILKCLGEMGYDHLQAPLVQFFLEETLCNNQLPNVKRSVLDYFMFTVKNKWQRKRLVHLVQKSQELLIWEPVKFRNFTLTTEEMEDNEALARHRHDLYIHLQQETRKGGDVGDNGRPGVGRDHEASQHKDDMASSKNDKQTTWDNSSGNKKKATESISLINHKQTVIGNIKLLTHDLRKGNEWLTVKPRFGNKNKTSWGANLESRTQKKNPGVFQAESPENEEGHYLLSGTADTGNHFFDVPFLLCLVFLAIFCTTLFKMMNID